MHGKVLYIYLITSLFKTTLMLILSNEKKSRIERLKIKIDSYSL